MCTVISARVKVVEVMEQLVARHGAPSHIRSDNGPEIVARSLGDWLGERKVKTRYLEPGSPWQHGYVESFHDKFRRECFARELFYTLSEARVIIGDWRRKYNRVRPHRSLGMETPAEFAHDADLDLVVMKLSFAGVFSDILGSPDLAGTPSSWPVVPILM